MLDVGSNMVYLLVVDVYCGGYLILMSLMKVMLWLVEVIDSLGKIIKCGVDKLIFIIDEFVKIVISLGCVELMVFVMLVVCDVENFEDVLFWVCKEIGVEL